MSEGEDDPLLRLFQRLRGALRPLGIQVDPVVLLLWRDAQASGKNGLFTAFGEFSPEVTRRLLAFADELRADTADEPTDPDQPS